MLVGKLVDTIKDIPDGIQKQIANIEKLHDRMLVRIRIHNLNSVQVEMADHIFLKNTVASDLESLEQTPENWERVQDQLALIVASGDSILSKLKTADSSLAGQQSYLSFKNQFGGVNHEISKILYAIKRPTTKEDFKRLKELAGKIRVLAQAITKGRQSVSKYIQVLELKKDELLKQELKPEVKPSP